MPTTDLTSQEASLEYPGGVLGEPVSGASSNPYAPGSAAYNLAGNTANSNLAASGSMIQLSDIINATNRAAQTAANNARLGPQGVDTQNTLLTNAQNEAQGLLDPQTEQMLQQGIAAGGNASGFAPDSAHLAAAYRMAEGKGIDTTEQEGLDAYLKLVAANPSAPIYDMSGNLVSPQTYAGVANANAGGGGASGGGSGGGGGRIGGGNPLTPTAAQANVPYGGGYAGPSGSQGSTSVNGQPVTSGVQYNADGTVNYNVPWTYDAPGGSSLVWSGQDWTNLFGDPYAGSSDVGSGGGLTLNPDTGIYDYGSTYTGGSGAGSGTPGDISFTDWSQLGDYYGS